MTDSKLAKQAALPRRKLYRPLSELPVEVRLGAKGKLKLLKPRRGKQAKKR